jgi:hypothetical protein
MADLSSIFCIVFTYHGWKYSKLNEYAVKRLLVILLFEQPSYISNNCPFVECSSYM